MFNRYHTNTNTATRKPKLKMSGLADQSLSSEHMPLEVNCGVSQRSGKIRHEVGHVWHTVFHLGLIFPNSCLFNSLVFYFFSPSSFLYRYFFNVNCIKLKNSKCLHFRVKRLHLEAHNCRDYCSNTDITEKSKIWAIVSICLAICAITSFTVGPTDIWYYLNLPDVALGLRL